MLYDERQARRQREAFLAHCERQRQARVRAEALWWCGVMALQGQGSQDTRGLLSMLHQLRATARKSNANLGRPFRTSEGGDS